jgi:hypothetical protein
MKKPTTKAGKAAKVAKVMGEYKRGTLHAGVNPKGPKPSRNVQKEKMKTGLYKNIHEKRKRIAAGSGEKMRKVGSKGAPTAKAFKQSAKTAKKK